MDSEKIKLLSEKYWNGQTSLEEETELRNLIQETDDPKWQNEKEWFSYLNESASLTMKVSLPKISSKRKQVFLSSKHIMNGLKIAATISILSLAFYFFYDDISKNEEQITEITDTFDDPQKAFEETKKALMLISSNIGKGRHEAEKLSEFSRAEQKLRTKNDN